MARLPMLAAIRVEVCSFANGGSGAGNGVRRAVGAGNRSGCPRLPNVGCRGLELGRDVVKTLYLLLREPPRRAAVEHSASIRCP
jgi:hypothetical protein